MDKHLLKKVATKIKTLRMQKGFTQDDLSFNSGIKRATLSNIELARNDVTLTKLNQLVQALDISLAEFFDLKN